MVRYIERKVKIKSKFKFDGLFPRFVRGRTVKIKFPIKEEGDKKISGLVGRSYGYR